jgi:branched-chain amino acid transport system permease protein
MLKKFTRDQLIFFGGMLLVFLVIQLAISLGLLNDFWNTILRIGAVMAIVSLGLNLIYGFNGQFSLGQWGFYAIGAYTAADITYRWYNNQSALALAIVLRSNPIFAQAAQPGTWYRSPFSLHCISDRHADPGCGGILPG